jgi:hypothetical protein
VSIGTIRGKESNIENMNYQVITGPDVYNQQGYQVIGGSPAGYEVIGAQPQTKTLTTQTNTSAPFRQRVKQTWSNVANKTNSAGNAAYDWSRAQYGLGADDIRQGFNASQMRGNAGKAFMSDINPLKGSGMLNLGMAGVGAGMQLVGDLNQGKDIDDSLAQAGGGLAGGLLGGATGSAAGAFIAPALAALGPVGMVAAAAAPFALGALGNMVGQSGGTAIGGGIMDLIDRDNDFTRGQDKLPVESLGKYAQFLSPDEQSSLANYLSLSDAQSQIDQRNALFANDLATQQMRDAAKINFENDAAMNTLNARIEAELQDRNNRYQMAAQNSQNIWNGLGRSQDFAARIYGA